MTFFPASKTFTLATYRYYHSATALSSSPILLHFLHLSTARYSLNLTQQCHAQIFSLGLTQDPFLASKLVSAYAVRGVLTRSQLVFDSLRHKSSHLWNTLINGYAKNRSFDEAFELFFRMCCCGSFLPDNYTLATLAKVCRETRDLDAGRYVHGKILRLGFGLDVVVANSVMSMYSSCGDFRECLKVFDETPERNVGSWNVVIGGYMSSGGCYEWISVFVKDMEIEGLRPDGFTVSSLLALCSGGAVTWNYGRELHGFVVRNELGLGSDVHLDCCLIDMYSRNDRVDVGRRVFEQIKRRNVYAWTAMINGYVQNGASEEAFALFREMQIRLEPNNVTLVSVLPACSSGPGLIGGKQIHGFAIRKALNGEVSLCNALIDMYSKCGSLNCARRVFEDAFYFRDAISWSSMICGYGLHGKGWEAVSLYDKVLHLGDKPDTITIVGVLSACCRSGLVDEGLRIYHSAINDYKIKPTISMCACVVDMLGRSGQLDHALDFIKMMPIKPGPSVWGALVSASIMHGNSKMQDLAYRFLIQLEPGNPSNYVSLSNLHASSRQWDIVAEVRTLMKAKGLRKTPGCSWINVSNATHFFYSADKVHPCSKSIYEMLDSLIMLMKGASNYPDLENMMYMF